MPRILVAIFLFAPLALGSCTRDDHTRHENNSIPPSRAAEQGLPSNSSSSAARPQPTTQARKFLENSANFELDVAEARLIMLKQNLDADIATAGICDEIEQLQKQILRIRTDAGRSRTEPEEERLAKMEQTQLAVVRISQRVQQIDERVRQFIAAESLTAQP